MFIKYFNLENCWDKISIIKVLWHFVEINISSKETIKDIKMILFKIFT